MSFLYNFTLNINPHKQKKYYSRKEQKDSLVTIKHEERASAFTSKGSLTLEAAIVVPIFFFAILTLTYLLEMMAIQTTVRNALYSVAKESADQAYTGTLLTSDRMEQRMVETIGRERLEQSAISRGASGLDCKETKCNWSSGVMDLSVRYQVEIPILMFRITPITCEETIRVKGWTGYVSAIEDEAENDIVYVTDTGIVYHRDADCTYLDMSIRSVHVDKLEELRNQSGGKYYPCEVCGKKAGESTLRYITEYGTRYHTSLECKKIKRNIYAISIEEAYGLGGCSKCVK